MIKGTDIVVNGIKFQGCDAVGSNNKFNLAQQWWKTLRLFYWLDVKLPNDRSSCAFYYGVHCQLRAQSGKQETKKN